MGCETPPDLQQRASWAREWLTPERIEMMAGENHAAGKLSVKDEDGDYIGQAFDIITGLAVIVCALEAQNALLKGAKDAQDERERLAGAECGVPYELHGCDWPWGVSEKVQAQRARICELEAQLADGPACISLQHYRKTVEMFTRWATTGRFHA